MIPRYLKQSSAADRALFFLFNCKNRGDIMQAPVTTNAVRRMLEELGAIKPTRRAVRMVAIKTEGGPFETSHWILRFDQGRIRTAIEACKGLEGEASYRAFALALQENKA